MLLHKLTPNFDSLLFEIMPGISHTLTIACFERKGSTISAEFTGAVASHFFERQRGLDKDLEGGSGIRIRKKGGMQIERKGTAK